MADLSKTGTNYKSSVNTAKSPLQLTSPKQRQGGYFERQACLFLQVQGLTLLAQNWQQPKVGELDLVMMEVGATWPILVFVEVRQRKRSNFGNATMSVTQAKQKKIIKTAKCFLQQHPKYADYECRFDVLAYDIMPFDKKVLNSVDSDKVDQIPEWLKGAFIAAAW